MAPAAMTGGVAIHDQATCECGCGQPTGIAKKNQPQFGQVRGQPLRFVKGHARRGVEVSAETRTKLSAAQAGSKGNNWKGDQAGYSALHKYLRKSYPKAGACEQCGKEGRTDYALIRGRTYSRNRADYRELCKRCHMRYDLGGKKQNPEAIAAASEGMRRSWARRRAQQSEKPQGDS